MCKLTRCLVSLGFLLQTAFYMFDSSRGTGMLINTLENSEGAYSQDREC